MAVVSVTEKGRSGGRNGKGERTYTRVFEVLFNSTGDGPLLARQAVGINRGDIYAIGNESDPGSYCQDVNENCISDDFLTYEVTVQYGPRQPNPLQQPPTMSLSFTTNDQQIEFDFQNRPVVNTCGDPFAEMIKRKVYSANLTYTRNQPTYNPQMSWMYAGVVNSDSFLGAPPGFARIVQIPGSSQYDEDIGTYYSVSYEIEFCTQGFKAKVLNQGMREKINGKIRTITNDDGVEISEPVLLDKNGRKLAQGAPPVYLEFQNYVTAPLSVFGIS